MSLLAHPVTMGTDFTLPYYSLISSTTLALVGTPVTFNVPFLHFVSDESCAHP